MSNHEKKHDAKRKRKNKRIIRQVLILLFLAIFLTLGYKYINYQERHLNKEIYTVEGDYVDLEVPDTANYLAVIAYKTDININTISNTFYKSNIFWPYIFIANKDIIDNPLNIPANAILKIPRLSDTILDLKNTASVKKVHFLGDSILESVRLKNLELLKKQ